MANRYVPPISPDVCLSYIQMTQTRAMNRLGLHSYGPRLLPRQHLLRSLGFVTDSIVVLLDLSRHIRL